LEFISGKKTVKDSWLWFTPADIEIEMKQAADEGKDTSSIKEYAETLLRQGAPNPKEFQKQAADLFDRISLLPLSNDYRYIEPNDLKSIKAERPPDRPEISSDFREHQHYDKIHGAWLGRCAGCLLGKPVEGAKSAQIHRIANAAGDEFITDYLWRMEPSREACEAAGRPNLISFGKTINAMPQDDDTNYTIIGMLLVRDYGINFTPRDSARNWMMRLPLLAACTAERAAYRNFALQIAPPGSALFRNPYREWIGAQIRADFFGYAAPGQPELAAELAWRDASISHVKNGIYGEMWAAAMLAAAAVESDPRKIVQAGLTEIPVNSRLSESLREVLQWQASGITYDEACERIHSKWNEYDMHHWCHTIPNAMVVSAALLWSEGNFEKAITQAVWPGFDTDCNGATAGSVMGMLLGAENLPGKWTALMNDTVHTSITGYSPARISETAREMYALSIT